MAYSPEQLALLQKYRLVKQDGTPVITKVFTKDDRNQPLGAGPKLAPDVIERFFSVTQDPEWLDWMFNQAAGGKAARDEMPRFTEQLKRKYVERRTQMQQEKGVPLSTIRAEMEDAWENYLASNADFFEVGDEEVAKKGAYGFFRHWPGPKSTGSNEGLYARLVRVVPEYLKTLPYIQRYNQREKDKAGVTPGQVSDVGQMEEITKKVQRYFAVQKAAKDVRIGGSKPVYDDDYLSIVVPLSYAASVRYGYQGWAWANKEQFQNFLERPSPDRWNEATQDNVYAYVKFHVPVPSTLFKESGAQGLYMSRRYLTHLAIAMPKVEMGRLTERALMVYSEEAGIKTSVENIRRSLRAEAERKDEPDSPENPIQQGPRVLKTKDEFIDAYLNKLGDSSDESMDKAERAWQRYFDEQEPDPADKPYLSAQKHTVYVEKVIKHFDAAIDTLLKWANKFDWSSLKSNTLSLD